MSLLEEQPNTRGEGDKEEKRRKRNKRPGSELQKGMLFHRHHVTLHDTSLALTRKGKSVTPSGATHALISNGGDVSGKRYMFMYDP